MDLSAMNLTFRFGNIFSLTPPSTRLKKRLPLHHKIRSFFVFTVLMINIFYNIYVRRISYSKLSITQVTMVALTNIIDCLHNSYIFVIIKIYKQIKWVKLLKHLQRTPCHKNKTKTYHLQFVTSQLFVSSILIAQNSTASLFFDLNLLRATITICIETYLQFFDATLRCIILQMVLSRYQYQNIVLTGASSHKLNYHSYLQILRRTKRDVVVLKNAVEVFNDIFGWTTLLHIFNASIRTLVNIDIFMRRDGTFSSGSGFVRIFNIVFHLTVLLLSWVRHLVLNHKCFTKDFVLDWCIRKYVPVRFYCEGI
jgi:hypothetical protein